MPERQFACYRRERGDFWRGEMHRPKPNQKGQPPAGKAKCSTAGKGQTPEDSCHLHRPALQTAPVAGYGMQGLALCSGTEGRSSSLSQLLEHFLVLGEDFISSSLGILVGHISDSLAWLRGFHLTHKIYYIGLLLWR